MVIVLPIYLFHSQFSSFLSLFSQSVWLARPWCCAKANMKHESLRVSPGMDKSAPTHHQFPFLEIHPCSGNYQSNHLSVWPSTRRAHDLLGQLSPYLRRSGGQINHHTLDYNITTLHSANPQPTHLIINTAFSGDLRSLHFLCPLLPHLLVTALGLLTLSPLPQLVLYLIASLCIISKIN